MSDNDYVKMQISNRAMNMVTACYENLQKKGLGKTENMFYLIGWIAGIARANDKDIVLDDRFMAYLREELKKWE